MALAPFTELQQPGSMKVVNISLNSRMNFQQANNLVKSLSPKHLLIPSQYYDHANTGNPNKTIQPNASLQSILKWRMFDTIYLPIKETFEEGSLSREVKKYPLLVNFFCEKDLINYFNEFQNILLNSFHISLDFN